MSSNWLVFDRETQSIHRYIVLTGCFHYLIASLFNFKRYTSKSAYALYTYLYNTTPTIITSLIVPPHCVPLPLPLHAFFLSVYLSTYKHAYRPIIVHIVGRTKNGVVL